MNQRTFLSSLARSFALAALASSASAQGPAPDHSDIVYGLPMGFHPDQVLDFYNAPGTGPRPVVVWLFGGGFHSGNETIDVSQQPFASWLANGWSIASVRYRHSAVDCQEQSNPANDFASYPDHLQDVSLAVQFLRQQDTSTPTGTVPGLWDIDGDRIVLYGRSAGGHLATWLALAEDRAAFTKGDMALTSPDGHGLQWSTRVRAARNGGGPTDWTYDNPSLPTDRSPYFGWFFGAPCSLETFDEAVPLAVQEFASPVWHAAQLPGNQNVGVWHQFSGLVGGNQHDPFYGVALNDELLSLGSPVSYLNWDFGPDFPADEVVSQLEWLGLMNTSVPYGDGYAGSGLTPALSLLRVGTQDEFLVANAPAGETVTLIVSVAPADVPFGGGQAYVDLSAASASVTLTAIADSAGDATFSTGALAGAKGLIPLYAQGGWVDANDPGGYALTQGLRLHFEDL